MKDILQYKGFIGSVHFSAEDECFFGRIEGIDDLITFEGQDVTELNKEFQEAVEDYQELCKLTGKSAQKSYKGSFNVRITPELHRKAAKKSLMLGMSLNQLVQKAIEEKVKDISPSR
jgi:predicted HicB family RNase H-like nuclease